VDLNQESLVPVEIPKSHRDLLETPGVGTVIPVGADGFPQSTAGWYLLDGEVVRTSLLSTRQKVRNLRRHPKATLFLLDPGNPYRTLELRCEATLADDPEREMFARIVRHYGQDPDTFPDDKTVNRVALTLMPVHVVTFG
jgi:PPOX class probable F420-dependent enzyme